MQFGMGGLWGSYKGLVKRSKGQKVKNVNVLSEMSPRISTEETVHST